MAITSPSQRPAIWAESGDQTAMSTGEQQAGYPAGKPSRRKTNWFNNWIDNAIQYLLTWGVPEYNASRPYPVGARVLYSGVMYRQVYSGEVSGVTPGTDESRWLECGITITETDSRINAKIGTLSGVAASGTITSSDGDSIVSDGYLIRSPGTSVKQVLFKLRFSSGHGTSRSATITLSGAAAMTTAIDNVIATLATGGYGGPVSNFPTIEAHKTGDQTLLVQSVYMPTASVDVDVHLLIQGH